MPSFARWLSPVATAVAVAVALPEEPACIGDKCGAFGDSAEQDEAAMLQVNRANESYDNPCGFGYSSLPKQSTQSACEKAGFKYIGNTGGAEDSSQCCVPATWVCNLGDKKHCKPDGVANPSYLGTITWADMDPRGNCCVPPNPATSNSATWAFDTQLSPKKKDCNSKKVCAACTIHAFWTGDKCMTTAEMSGVYKVPVCKKTLGSCKGASLGSNYCCTCPSR
jgi:hypothetical protein